MPLRSDPTQAAQDWATGLGQSTDKIRRGIARVQTAPGVKAAQKVDKYRQGIMDNIDKWRTNVGRVSLADWQAAATAGVGRVAEGAQLKQGKMQSFMQEFFPHLQNVVNQVDQMPDSTLEQRIQKSVALQRGLAQFRRRGTTPGA